MEVDALPVGGEDETTVEAAPDRSHYSSPFSTQDELEGDPLGDSWTGPVRKVKPYSPPKMELGLLSLGDTHTYRSFTALPSFPLIHGKICIFVAMSMSCNHASFAIAPVCRYSISNPNPVSISVESQSTDMDALQVLLAPALLYFQPATPFLCPCLASTASFGHFPSTCRWT